MLAILLLIHVLVGLFVLYLLVKEELECNGVVLLGDFAMAVVVCLFMPVFNWVFYAACLRESKTVNRFFARVLFGGKVKVK